MDRYFPTFTGAYRWLISQHEKDFKIQNLETKVEELESTVESLEEFKTKLDTLDFASAEQYQKPCFENNKASTERALLFEEAKECIEELVTLSDDEDDLRIAIRVLEAYEEHVLSEQVDNLKGYVLNLLANQNDRTAHKTRLKRYLKLTQESLDLNDHYPHEKFEQFTSRKSLFLYARALNGLKSRPHSKSSTESQEKHFRTFLQCLAEEA